MFHRLGALVLPASFLLCASGGCAHLPPAVSRSPTPLAAETASYYEYPRQPIESSQEFLSEREGYTVQLVRWPLADRQAIPPSEATIEVEWYESSQPGKRAALLVLPILGGHYPIERAFCRFFAYRGVHVALVRRRTIKLSATESPADLEAMLRRSVIRNRQVMDWLETQPSVDATRLGVFGISMGGIVGVMTAAVEPRVQALVAGLAGGPIADILCDTQDPILLKPRARYLAKRSLTLHELHRQLTAAIRTDPLLLAPAVDGHRVFLVMAGFDRTIRSPYSRRLWEALNRPQRLVLPLGHYTSLLAVPHVETRALRFFRRTLHLPPTTLPRRRWRVHDEHGIMDAVPRITP